MNERKIYKNKDVIANIDKIIHAQRELEKAMESTTEFKVCQLFLDKRLHLVSGIEIVARALGKTVYFKKVSGGYPNYYSFEYMGVTIFQMTKTPIDNGFEKLVKDDCEE